MKTPIKNLGAEKFVHGKLDHVTKDYFSNTEIIKELYNFFEKSTSYPL